MLGVFNPSALPQAMKTAVKIYLPGAQGEPACGHHAGFKKKTQQKIWVKGKSFPSPEWKLSRTSVITPALKMTQDAHLRP